jgi:hypothetical protein
MTIVVFSLMNKVGATYEGLPRSPRSSLLGPTRDTLGKLLLLLLLKTKGGSIIGSLQGKLLLLLLITTINYLKENIPYDHQYSLGNS